MRSIRKERFDWAPFLKTMFLLAVPVALQNLLTTTASMVDTMMIAPLGETSVGAVGLCAQFSTLMLSCYWGFVGGSILFYSQYWGAQDHDGIDRSYGLTFICMMTVSVIFFSLARFFPTKVMAMYTDKESVQDIGIQYLKIVGFAYPFQVFSLILSVLLRSTERVRIPLLASICSVCTNIFLNWCLIYGHLGFPALGIKGAAVATVCAAVVNTVVIFIAAGVVRYPYIFHFRKHFDFKCDHTAQYFRKCFPIILNEVGLGIGNMVINIVLGHQSEQSIAAVAVFRTLEGLVIAFFSGFSSASSIIVGKNVGSGNLRYAWQRAVRIIYICGGTILVVCLCLFGFHTRILHVMGLSGQSFEIGTMLLGVYCVAATFRMMNWAQNDTFRSAGDSTYGTILEITFMYLMVIPGLLLSAYVFNAPFAVVFCCCYSDEIIRFILMQIHLFSGKWIKPVTELGRKQLDDFLAGLRK